MTGNAIPVIYCRIYMELYLRLFKCTCGDSFTNVALLSYFGRRNKHVNLRRISDLSHCHYSVLTLICQSTDGFSCGEPKSFFIYKISLLNIFYKFTRCKYSCEMFLLFLNMTEKLNFIHCIQRHQCRSESFVNNGFYG